MGLALETQDWGGFGGVVRITEENIIWAYSGLARVCESSMVETLALTHGLKCLGELGMSGTIVEGDCSSVISWGKVYVWALGD